MRALTAGLALAIVLTSGGPVCAQGPHQQHYDTRYGHNHYYPEHGMSVAVAPHGGVPLAWHGDHYWYHGGVWYRPYGPSWVVVGPPVGIYVPVLPPVYTTVVFGGVPYYYANDAYYLWSDSERQYQVVAPPPGADSASAAPSDAVPPPPSASGAPIGGSPVGDNLFVYPRNGQTAEQQANDRYECHRWAVDQSGFDPTPSGGGVAPEQAAAGRADYRRAIEACLDGRGYTVR
jgi:hypothetical protein